MEKKQNNEKNRLDILLRKKGLTRFWSFCVNVWMVGVALSIAEHAMVSSVWSLNRQQKFAWAYAWYENMWAFGE